jgi:hypothetical protein
MPLNENDLSVARGIRAGPEACWAIDPNSRRSNGEYYVVNQANHERGDLATGDCLTFEFNVVKANPGPVFSIKTAGGGYAYTGYLTKETADEDRWEEVSGYTDPYKLSISRTIKTFWRIVPVPEITYGYMIQEINIDNTLKNG